MAKKKANTEGKVKGKKPTESANTEKGEGISTENATTEVVIAEKKKGISCGSDRVLRSRGTTVAYDKGKEKEVAGFDEKDTRKKPSKVVEKAKGKKPNENANTEKVEGMPTENATTEETQTTTDDLTTEKKKGISSGNVRVVRGRGAITAYDKGKEKEVVVVDGKPSKVLEKAIGKKPITEGIKLVVDLSIKQNVASKEAGDTPTTRESGTILKEKLVLGGSGRSLRPRTIKKVDDIADGKKGIKGSEVAKKGKRKEIEVDLSTKRGRREALNGKEVDEIGKKGKGKKPAGEMPLNKVREDHDDVKAATSIETADEMKGIDGSKAVKKAKGDNSTAPKVGSEANVSVRRNPGRTVRKNQEIRK